MTTSFSIQPHLKNERVLLCPLQEEDFEELYAVASDPAIWEQHPNKNRWRKEVFRTFFEGAMESKGAFKIIDKQTNAVAGSTRIYDYNFVENSILIGYTFYGVQYWGTGINHSVKKLMLDYLFQYVDKIYFHIGAVNKRSQISLERLGALKVEERQIEYYGEDSNLNFVYCIERAQQEK
jgi:RimJ/RimL family protein N-acetyltransferase